MEPRILDQRSRFSNTQLRDQPQWPPTHEPLTHSGLLAQVAPVAFFGWQAPPLMPSQ
jgi:hypothetical protein